MRCGTLLHEPNGSFFLSKLDDNEIPNSPGEVRVVGNIKNEILLLPYFFEYYRRLGVKRFFLTDDHSDDGTREYCVSQPDTHVFSPSNTYSDSFAGTKWQNVLLNTFGNGFWTLVVDADELLVYPHSETTSLPRFCGYMDREGSSACFAFLLDMYSKENVSKAEYSSGQEFLGVCPYFDSEYTFSTWNFDENADSPSLWPAKALRGGPRARLFYPLQRRPDYLSRAVVKAIVLSGKLLPSIYGDDLPHHAPALAKVPLVKWHQGCERISAHYIKKTPEMRLASVTGALLHFKFFSGFFEKASREAQRKEHFKGGQEYRRYLSYIKKHGDFSFFYRGSMKYDNSSSLQDAGLISSTVQFDKFALEAN